MLGCGKHGTFYIRLQFAFGKWKRFKKMCSLAKSGSTLTCKLVRKPDGNTYWVSECCGYYSKTKANRYVNYSSVLPKISPDNLCTINEKTWKGISKWLKKNKGFNSIGLVIIKHKENDNRITFTINGMYDNHDGIEISCECENVPNKNFAIGLKVDSLLRFENFNFTLGRYANEALVYVGSLEIGMMMSMYIDDEYDGFKLSDGYIGAYDYCGFAESFDMPTNEPTEDVIPTKVDNVTAEEKECATEEKTEQTNAPAKVVPLDKPSNKFSFDAVGVNVGDALTFIDGTEVIAAEDNKVSFCGELFTLSGFCKEFMPDDKRTKSNTYRGCAFFFKDGVKLEKLFKEQQKKSLVSSKEEITVSDDTLDSVPNEHQTSEKCTERTITPLANKNVSERKETASTAKVVAISIGVPVCLDIPPNNMRLDIAANKPLNAAVGDCLCGVGKVVHTLPLPPPRSKGMSKITKVNQLIKKQKWKRIFVYLADLHSEMANAIDL